MRPRVHDDVTRALGSYIVNGRIAPGHTLPNETQLGTQYGVSRSVIRESLRVLSAKGLIQARSRIGTVVRDIDQWRLMDADILEWTHEGPVLDRLLASLIEARLAIEPQAARLAAARASSTDLLAIKTAVELMKGSAQDSRAHMEADYQFHAAVIAASGNIVFEQFLAGLRKVLIESFRRTMARPDQHTDVIDLHEQVYEAIRAKDGDAAARASEALLIDARNRLFEDIRL